MSKLAVVTCFALVLGGPVLAQTSTAPTGTAASPAAKATVRVIAKAAPAPKTDEKLICRREKVIGSIRETRVCRTQAEIDDLRHQAESVINRSNDLDDPSVEHQRGPGPNLDGN